MLYLFSMAKNIYFTKFAFKYKAEIHVSQTRYFQPSSAWLGRSTGETEEPKRI